MNLVILNGRLTRDPELRYLQSGVATTSFTLACDRKFKNKQGEKEADFINCVAFDRGNYKLAEYLGNDLVKGQPVTIQGTLRVRNYENKEGNKVWVTEVIVDEASYRRPPKDAHGDGWEQPSGGVVPPDDSDIPF